MHVNDKISMLFMSKLINCAPYFITRLLLQLILLLDNKK